MENKDKQLLLKDLCARLPYGVTCQLSDTNAGVSITEKLKLGGLEHFIVSGMDVKPYLRPMSSMTEEEKKQCKEYFNSIEGKLIGIKGRVIWLIDWFNVHHFDYRGLIEKGLALEAKEGMYKTE